MEDSRSLKKAEISVKQGRIVKLVSSDSFFSIFVFLGKDKSKDHILDEDSCDCKSFVFRKIYRGDGFCYHVLALKMAMEKENYRTLRASSKEVFEVLLEIHAYGKSLKLRKLLVRQ
ncbi:MAG: metal binding protein [Candidatus Aramenus sulfurataquae]|jgi:predicted nucleic acid-binding Zn finger protein|uniref:Metal-binding protein n=2 Tax=Candidatus Aramenus sulfurataquae TaxID=1326980 RepID=W7KVH1_9CREN|nr:MAG: metal binding protein [Candidatus Aramenus sulfurataquae]MBW9140523.1 metal-binding protein [Candidatus Aramenus sp.]MCL7343379.1 metal-binding protein [Candidatus Aramenus sulfurataquae]